MSANKYDPCPCGSGKKFKFCCYEKSGEITDQREPQAGMMNPLRNGQIPDSASDADTETILEMQCDNIWMLIETGDFAAAHAQIEGLLNSYPHRWEPSWLKGSAHVLEGKADDAIRYFKQSIAIKPTSDAHYGLAAAYQQLMQGYAYIESLQAVARLEGEHGEFGRHAREQIAAFAVNVKQEYRVSLERFLEVGKIFHRAQNHFEAGRLEEALQGFTETIKAIPNHVQAHGNIGAVYVALGDRKRALEYLDKAIALDPTYEPALHNRRMILSLPVDAPTPLRGKVVDYYADEARKKRTGLPRIVRPHGW